MRIGDFRRNMKKVIVLGSTGSIGTNALAVIEALPDRLQAVALAANNNWKLLCEQALRFKPAVVCIADAAHYQDVQRELKSSQVKVLAGKEGLCELAFQTEADVVVTGITGAAGLAPTLECIRSKKTIALANKESLVVAGPLLTRLAKEHGAAIVPVDSEHSAVHQAIGSTPYKAINKVTLTASGGPFVDRSKEQMAEATVEAALNHPTWKMGPVITVNSATLVNKALEVIEAHWLFGVSTDQIEILVHRQSVVHSMVEFVDNSVVAQLGVPDMKLPIQYALTHPERCVGIAPKLDLAQVGTLTFEPVDQERFPAVTLGYRAAYEEGSMGAVFNAANEVAVGKFLARQIRFGDIIPIVEEVMAKHRVVQDPSLEQIFEADRWARTEA